tara:strand:- start:4464 stop:7502 length:3039 start_codon:yes stop_codon:yes gene_type:complete
MKKMVTTLSVILVPFCLFGQLDYGQMINNFDAAPADPNYWGYDASENSDSTLSFVNVSYVADPVSEGAGAMQLDYSAHNIEAWGGYAKIFHMSGGGDDGSGSPIEGTWMLAPEAGALMVGPAANNGDWWTSSEDDVTARACYFDDEYVFGADGSFQNVQGTETWLETWQGVDSDQCGAPVAPHDGSNAATWDYNAGTGTVTLNGVGAYLGLPKANNAGELPNVDVPESITYDATLSGNTMTLVIECGTGVFWTFKLVTDEPARAEPWDAIFDNDLTLLPRTGGVWDWSGYDSISFSYYNSVAQIQEAGGSQTVHLRVNLSDYGDVADPANYDGLGEYYYSFHYILDNAPGWNTITMPLERNDSWDGGGFNLTGWSGDPGNGELDSDAIGGFHFEFSIDGGGDSTWNHGTIILDDFKLTGSKNVLSNAGFELEDGQDDGFGWGSALGGGHAQVLTGDGNAHSGESYFNIGVTDNWAVYYTEDNIPAQYGETWLFSGYGKNMVSGGDGGGAAFKLDAKDADGTVVETTGDVFFVMTDEWENHSIEFVMPEGAVTITAVIVASRWDGVACDFAFDDMFLMNSGILDVVPPVAVTNVGATIDDYANLVTWVDVDGEEGETYNVYTSTVPIEDVTSSSVDVVKKKALEGSPAAVHYLHNPLVDTEVTSYYAVTCVDASNNVGAPGVSGSVTNTARGVPTISMTPPAAFEADGDLSEWYDSGIAPFEIGAADNSYGTPHIGFGVVDDDDDLYGTFFAAVDNDYFYLAAEITDNDVNTEGTGGWWTTDVVQLCIGLYDQRGAKHVGQQRGAEPDYKMYFTPAGANSDNGAGVLAAHGDGNYFHSVFNPDYAFEFRISLDSLVIEDDARLIPVNGMRTPFELMIHDNDGGTWEGQLTLSNTNDDNAHQTCEVWSNTWIGDQSTILETDQDLVAHEFALFPNYPNPFNPVTTIRFSLPEKQHVTLQIYNLIGQEVATVINKELPAGFHNLIWNAENIPSGVYLYRLASKEKAISNKMILLK